MTAKHFQAVALAVLIGCAGSGTRTPVAPRTGTYLSAAEVAAAHAETGSAYDAIARLRPNWLAAHGMSTFDSRQVTEYATVFIDGQQHGGLSTLRNIPASHIKDFRYYDVTQAGATFGLQAGTGGVIELRVR
jgi:hypothetical protein